MTAAWRAAGEAGFALAETLVAVAVIAAMVGVMSETIATAGRSARQARDVRAALAVAQSRLALAAGHAVGAGSGREDGLEWRVDVAPYQGVERTARSVAPPLVRIEVGVARSGERAPLVRLQTLRIGA